MARRKAVKVLIAAGVLAILVAVAIGVAINYNSPYLAKRVVTALNHRFHSQVDLESLQVSAFPQPAVSGARLALRHNGRTDVPPLITIERFSSTAGVRGLFASPLRLGTIALEGLEIHVPPGGLGKGAMKPSGKPLSLAIDRIEAREARLEIASKDPAKLPRVFEIHDLVMKNFRPDTPASFTATLTNPLPAGQVQTRGEFGPWRADDPEQTALDGSYVFKNANLDTIGGLGGILSSTGDYDGTLERIEVRGQTDTPDFHLDLTKQPVPLKTRFIAVVDGTNGNTWLQQVVARIAETEIHVEGSVVRARDVKGRQIVVNTRITEGRLEDLLRLAVAADRAPMSGRLNVDAKLIIPPGDVDVVDKMRLDGRFHLSSARFANVDVQKRLGELSRRGRGVRQVSEGASVVSNLSGRFTLRDSRMQFSDLQFGVPGAVVQLSGSYGLRTEALDFKGNLLLDASLRETTTGVRSVLAMLAQPLFRRPGGGSKLPIKVSGTRSEPAFGLDVRRALLPGD
jgi:hypothetical protein